MDSLPSASVDLQRAAVTVEELEALGCENGETGLGDGYGILQDPWELAGFLGAIDRTWSKPIRYLEVGLGRGGLFRLITERVPTTIAAGIDNRKCRRFQESLDRNLAAITQPIMLIEADSDSDEVIEKFCEWDSILVERGHEDGLQFDVVFIDADHSYEAVKRDIETFRPWVADGGWLCFHDTIYSRDVRLAMYEHLCAGWRAVYVFEKVYGICCTVERS